ncbi:MAG TPA: DUF177 domain-containing protein [Kofleriaceae bacterium]|jgi:uncharacterized protein
MAKPPREKPFVVLVRDLPLHKTFEIGPQLVSAWLAGHPMRDALEAPPDDPNAGHGRADLDLYAEDVHAFANGTFKGEVHVACSRCVGDVTLVIDEQLRVTFMPASEIPVEDDEPKEHEGDGTEVAADDLDLFPFDGESIDLEPLFREQFVLAVPYAPVCREDCAGLCPHCGIDRNTGTCTCEAPIDPRLAPLAALKGLKSPS